MVPIEETAPPTNTNGVINSPPQIRWASIVRGGAGAESVSSPPPISPPPPMSPPPPEKLDNNNPSPSVSVEDEVANEVSDNAGQPRRPVWNTPSNGVVEPGPVMGAVAWPALSESTRPVSRSWVESARPVGEGSVSTSQAPIIAQPPPQRTANTNSHPHPAANSTMPTRPRSRNRGGGSSSGSGPSQHNFNRPAAPSSAPLGPPFPVPVFEQPYGMVPTVQEASIRGPRAVGNSQPHAGNDHSGVQSHRNNSRRGNFGSRPRGEGQYHNNQGGRRDQDRRDTHLTPPFPQPVVFVPPPIPPPGTGPFMPGQHMRVFPPQMGGFEMAPAPHFFYPVSPESFRPMAINAGPLPMIFSPMNESPVANLIVKQFDYYFSDDNLVKDNFLRSNMDENGWVLVPLVASFPRVQRLSKDINEILEALRHSTIVEIQGDKVRRRNDWSRWLSSSGSNGNNSGSRTPGVVTENVLATSMQQVSLDDSWPSANGSMGPSEGCSETVAYKSLPEDTADDSRLTNGEEDASEEAH